MMRPEAIAPRKLPEVTLLVTLLIAPIFGHTLAELRGQIDLATAQGADAVELRLDFCDGVGDDDIRQLRTDHGLPMILTIRSVAEGGGWDGNDMDRVSRLIELGPHVDFIDVELEVWRRSANIRQKVGLALQRAGHISQHGGVEEIEQAAKRKLILSKHDQAMRPTSLNKDLLEMVTADECTAPKIAWRARTVRDNFEAFELMRSAPKKSVVICMGTEGIASRVLAKKFNAFATFASAERGRQTASGQLSISEMKSLYRWDAINAATQVYGVIGDPISHSLSPRVHNAAFEGAGRNAVYLPFRVDPHYESFKAFLVETLARPWADFLGFSVTVPHKESALQFLREHDGHVDPRAGRLGAVNTLWIEGDTIAGFNTDGPAILQAICEARGCEESELEGMTVAVLGAGGVARAAVGMLVEAGATVNIFNRTPERAKALAGEFGCEVRPWSERVTDTSQLLINCTSVGLDGAGDELPLPDESLHVHELIFDTVYHPGGTPLVNAAKKQNIAATDGMGMFILQAEAQFAIWTGKAPPAGVMAAAVAELPAG